MPSRTALIRLSSLGDILLTTATLTNLRCAYPTAEILLVTREKFSRAATLLGADRVVAIPEPVSPVALWNSSRTLDALGIDQLIDLHGNWRTALLRCWIGAQRISVYPRFRFERRQLIGRAEESDTRLSVVSRYNDALRQVQIPVITDRPVIRIPELHHLRGQRRNQIILAPGAAHATKRWPLGSFLKLGKLLASATNAEILWVTSAGDGLHQQLTDNGVDKAQLLVSLELSELAVTIGEGMLTIANDSGIMHLSSVVRTPVLGIFGPTHPALGFAPTGIYDEMAQVPLFCRPCSLHGKKQCWRSEQFCFTTLSPDVVAAQALRMYNAQRARRPALVLDRDGTLIVNHHYNADPALIEFLPGALEAIRRARSAGFAVIVVSNQSGVARGLFSLQAAEQMNAALLEKLASAGAPVDGSYFCPHHPDHGGDASFRRPCRCRKPASGMIDEVAQRLSLDMGRLAVIGDSPDDLNLGLVLGAERHLLRSGHGPETEREIGKWAAAADIQIHDHWDHIRW